MHFYNNENSEKRHPSRTRTSNMRFWSHLEYTQLYTQLNNSGDNGLNITAAATASTTGEAAETEVDTFFFLRQTAAFYENHIFIANCRET